MSLKTTLRRLAAGCAVAALATTTFALPASARTPDPSPAPSFSRAQGSTSTSPSSPQRAEGWRSWLAGQLLRQVANQIRRNVDGFIRLCEGHGWIDAAASAELRANAPKIANIIDDVAETPDMLSSTVRMKLRAELERNGVEKGTAQVIATCVDGVLWLLM